MFENAQSKIPDEHQYPYIAGSFNNWKFESMYTLQEA